MTYDTATRQIALFGGYTNAAATVYPTTMWTWNGRNWQQE